LLPKLQFFASAAGKLHLRPTIEFVIAIALLGDALVVLGSLWVGYWIRFHSGLVPLAQTADFHAAAPTVSASLDHLRLLFMGTVLFLGTFAYLRFYSRDCFMRFFRTAKVISLGSCFWLAVYLTFSLTLESQPSIPRLAVVFSFVCVFGALLLWRSVFYNVMGSETLAAHLRQKVLFVGWGKEAEQFAHEIRRDRNHSCDIIGYLPSPQSHSTIQPPTGVPVLGDYQQLHALLEQRRPDIVILADLNLNLGEITKLSNVCEMGFAQFKVIPSYFQILASGLRLESISGVPVLGVSELPLNSFFNRVFKRTVDIVGAIVGLVFSAPLIAIFGALVYRESPGPIFYRQNRVSRSGRAFKMLKIRSMRTGSVTQNPAKAEVSGKPSWWVKENDPRVLKIGAFMRKWNIDEVPQFWNVLKGEMSLVGPRPEQPETIAIFEHKVPHYHARHTCLPGITGWAQVNGWRGDTSLEERIRHDIWYVENWSLTMDLRIMILTLGDCFFGTQRNAY
jgi:exopolysaccharide biosynthesis polyprenyl glycosylphosphotransferase